MHREIELSIITVNYNGYKDTCELIDTLPLDDKSLEVIVVDNGSRDDEAALLKQRYPAITAIRSERNVGFAGGNNIGMKASSGKYLFLVNNDTIFKNRNFHNLTSRLCSSPTIGMVCPKICFAYDERKIQFAGYTKLSPVTLRNRAIGYNEDDCGQHDTAYPTPYAHGAAMMIKRSAIESAGPMPECYFLYYEELDWSVRLHEAGYEIWYDPSFTIYHKESRSTGTDSPLKTFYITRNRLLFAKRNTNGIERLAAYFYLITIASLKNIITHSIKGRFDLVKSTVSGIVNFLKS